MSAACTATFALIAMSAALPSNKILTVTPEINRPKGRLPSHSNTLGHFWLSPESHNERKTRGCNTELLYYRTDYAAFISPSANRQFSKPNEALGCKPQRPRRTPALACQHIRGKDVRYDREADTLARLDSGDGCGDGGEHTRFSAKPPRHRHWSDNCQRL